MKIIVKAKPRAKKEKVEQIKQPSLNPEGVSEPLVYAVSVTQSPVDGSANEAIAKALAKHFDISVSRIKLSHGAKSKQKIFEILYLSML